MRTCLMLTVPYSSALVNTCSKTVTILGQNCRRPSGNISSSCLESVKIDLIQIYVHIYIHMVCEKRMQHFAGIPHCRECKGVAFLPFLPPLSAYSFRAIPSFHLHKYAYSTHSALFRIFHSAPFLHTLHMYINVCTSTRHYTSL